jgi:hypothetical protein
MDAIAKLKAELEAKKRKVGELAAGAGKDGGADGAASKEKVYRQAKQKLEYRTIFKHQTAEVTPSSCTIAQMERHNNKI